MPKMHAVEVPYGDRPTTDSVSVREQRFDAKLQPAKGTYLLAGTGVGVGGGGGGA